MPSLIVRIDLDRGPILGPGKVELLEKIEECGSISAAARKMNMSYKRAWDLIEETKGIFGKPLIETKTGGKAGGGATLTEAGAHIVARFRAIEAACLAAAQANLEALRGELAT